MNDCLTGKVVWVTGSSKGIGRAIAQKFSEHDCHLVLTARSEEELHATAVGMSKVLILPGDVTQKSDVETIASKIIEKLQRIDILVNNAGTAIFKKIIDLEEDEWDKMMTSNAKSAFLCTKTVLPHMIAANNGHIVNIISVAAEKPYFKSGAYGAAKAAMLAFSDVTRLENRKYGIAVTSVLPGATDTDIWGSADVDRSKMMQPQDIATAIVNCCALPKAAVVEMLRLRPQGGDL